MCIRSISKSLKDRDADRAWCQEDSLDGGAQARELKHKGPERREEPQQPQQPQWGVLDAAPDKAMRTCPDLVLTLSTY